MATKETLKQLQKIEAIKRMQALGLAPNVIKDFDKNGKVYYSERMSAMFDGILYWLDNNNEYVQAVREFERKYNALVYHAQLCNTSFGVMLSMLYVSRHKSEWSMDYNDICNKHDGVMYVYAYVHNITDEDLSEIGRIGIIRKNGGISRVC